MTDPTYQVGGDHYTSHEIQPWDIIDEYNLGFYTGNVIKYMVRQKGDHLEDLKKARHYLDKAIEIEEKSFKPMTQTFKEMFDTEEHGVITWVSDDTLTASTDRGYILSRDGAGREFHVDTE